VQLDPAYADHFRQCLLELDVSTARRIWQHVAPGLPQPASDDEALVMMHAARVEMQHMPRRARDYSRAWLDERERRQIVTAVGIAVGLHSESDPKALERSHMIRDAMADAVADAYREGVDLLLDAEEVRRRMIVARKRA
jgi:hypothetical protein